jgi:hypothetical protein
MVGKKHVDASYYCCTMKLMYRLNRIILLLSRGKHCVINIYVLEHDYCKKLNWIGFKEGVSRGCHDDKDASWFHLLEAWNACI